MLYRGAADQPVERRQWRRGPAERECRVQLRDVVEAYQQQTADGNVLKPVFGGWDLLKNIQFGDTTC